jgi:hypothetical protein
VLCSLKNPLVDSKHDIIVSSFKLPFSPFIPEASSNNAPEIPNKKHRVLWSEESIQSYRDLLAPNLISLQKNWDNAQSSVSFSLLLQCTKEVLVSAAKCTQKTIDLTKEPKPKKTHIPPEVSTAANQKLLAHQAWVNVSEDPSANDFTKAEAKQNFKTSRSNYRTIWRRHLSEQASNQHSDIHSILGNEPSKAFKKLKSLKSTPSSKISEL